MKKKSIIKVGVALLVVAALAGGIITTDFHTLIDPDVGTTFISLLK